MGITGDDAWRPKILVVWGERATAEPIVPLGIVLLPIKHLANADSPVVDLILSTDSSEGIISFTIRPVRARQCGRDHSFAVDNDDNIGQ